MGIACGLMAVWMLLYSVYGKLKHRDRILNMIDWKGSEMVLDVGTGRGLLAIVQPKDLQQENQQALTFGMPKTLQKIKLRAQQTMPFLKG